MRQDDKYRNESNRLVMYLLSAYLFSSWLYDLNQVNQVLSFARISVQFVRCYRTIRTQFIHSLISFHSKTEETRALVLVTACTWSENSPYSGIGFFHHDHHYQFQQCVRTVWLLHMYLNICLVQHREGFSQFIQIVISGQSCTSNVVSCHT